MLSLNGLEQSFEVSGAETLVISSLDNFEEESWSVFQRFCEELKEVAFFVIVYKDLMLLQNVNVFLDFKSDIRNTCSQIVVVCVRDFIEELNATVFHSRYCFDNIFCAHGNMLNSSSTVIVAIFLNLTLSLSICRLIDWHLDLLVEVGHND